MPLTLDVLLYRLRANLTVLDHLEFINVTLGVRVPGTAGIFQCRADECLMGRSLK